ncbi:MAG TPA: DegT/DnrJ/EryC1/StrS family aminotransferase, partial [Deltaproteobacteria bacterium]|nr:DegT/DnrJ/EryC1/StrS family aminotransferase [Deltaproteobacteria bacterium]
RRYFYPGCHAMEPYRSYFPHAGLLLPNTETVLSQVVSLPTGTSVGIEDIDRICDMIQFIMHNTREIAARLADGQQRN